MPFYLCQVGYTAEAWAAMARSPQDRVEAVRPIVERMGGRVECGYLAFGDYDLIAILEMPDNESVAAFAIAASAGGAVKAFKTTPLLTTAQGVEAMSKASGSGYAPPEGVEPAWIVDPENQG